jgi:hypothetical protein
MPASQLLICTAIPRSLSVDPRAVPVSLVISPRLRGDDTLGSYPDWVDWTERRRERGLRVVLECAGETRAVDLPVAALRPDVWRALFGDETFVRSHTFDDYTGRFVSSYPLRSAAGVLQATYQAAGLALALPAAGTDGGERHARRRRLFRQLLGGYALQWSEDDGRRWRAEQIAVQQAQVARWPALDARRALALADLVGEDGLVRSGALDPGASDFASTQSDVVQRFGVFSHVPPGAPVSASSLDTERVLDFHQALSALNAYPGLLRLLGLVYDLELPLDFVADTAGTAAGVLRVTELDGDWSAEVTTIVPQTSTAYVNASLGGRRVVALAPRALVEQDRPLAALGLVALDPSRYGIMQLDVDGALHKAVMLADAITQLPGEAAPPTADVFDPTTTLSSLRSGGFSLFADARALVLLDSATRAKAFSDAYEAAAPSPGPLCAEDVIRGYRLDVWDSRTRRWHSLHRKHMRLAIGDPPIPLDLGDSEGFFQLAATRAAPAADGTRPSDDLYLHEAVVRWSGWSLSAETVGKHLTRAGDPDAAVPDAQHPDREDAPLTPFKLTASNTIVAGTLPRLRFGTAYRFRLRVVDLAGNGLLADDAETVLVTPLFSLPSAEGVVPYLRFEPVAAPVVVLRDERGLTGEGSSTDRLVLRTWNSDPSLDGAPADLAASDRHIAPPRTHVELAERHGMFDDARGKPVGSEAMWKLIKERDAGGFQHVVVDEVVIDGEKQSFPLEPDAGIAELPYLPDPLARAAALRDLPGAPAASVARVRPGAGGARPVRYDALADARPLPVSVTIVEFGGRDDWQDVRPFRLALAEGRAAPTWDAGQRLLTVSLPKGSTHVLPLSSCPDPDDLKYLGVWKWLKEAVELVSERQLGQAFLDELDRDRSAHLLVLAASGGHGMLTPPHLLTLVHAVQQPLGRPRFSRLAAQLDATGADGLQTQPEAAPTAPTELDVLQAWRHPGDTDAWLVGALELHGASTAKVDIRAQWTDPVDDLEKKRPGKQSFSAPVDELPLPALAEGYLRSDGDRRAVGYYNAAHDLICFAPAGVALGELASGAVLETDAAPCHRIGDARHHVVSYTAVSTSRYREYFPAKDGAKERDFTRTSDPVTVHVPASARPVAPEVRYVVPTFGWQREARGDQVRSVRLGGGLRVYLERPWYSSGAGELLGVALPADDSLDREEWKPFITQWGQDPIWESAPLDSFPEPWSFPDAVASERDLPLDALVPGTGQPRRIAVAGHEVHFDEHRGLWYCDLTVDTKSAIYAPFVRLALVRYQPHALVEAKVSRVVLADFCQLTPERSCTLTADPYERGTFALAVSGPAPRGPVPARRANDPAARPTRISVTVQERDTATASDLAWSDAPDFVVDGSDRDTSGSDPDFVLWTGSVRYAGSPGKLRPRRYRILIQEHELLEADGVPHPIVAQRLVYAETLPLDQNLLATPRVRAARTER